MRREPEGEEGEVGEIENNSGEKLCEPEGEGNDWWVLENC
jgi:hypothetical protein